MSNKELRMPKFRAFGLHQSLLDTRYSFPASRLWAAGGLWSRRRTIEDLMAVAGALSALLFDEGFHQGSVNVLAGILEGQLHLGSL
jgi:hypothetical protein